MRQNAHKSWQTAPDHATSAWAHAFSVASDAFVSSAAFPARVFGGESVTQWIDRISLAIQGG